MNTIGIIGCGWLAQKWINSSANLYKITTRTGIQNSPSNNILETLSFDATLENLSAPNWSDCDYILCSITFSKRNSLEINKKMASQTIIGLTKLNKPVIVLSSIGIYTEDNGTITEKTESLNPTIAIAEELFATHLNATILRLGGLMGEERYLSKYLSEGDHQPVNHIHYKDVIKAIEWIMENNKWNETFNLVAPEHPSRNEVISFQKTGIVEQEENEMLNARIIDSTKIISEGFQFDFPNPIYFK